MNAIVLSLYQMSKEQKNEMDHCSEPLTHTENPHIISSDLAYITGL